MVVSSVVEHMLGSLREYWHYLVSCPRRYVAYILLRLYRTVVHADDEVHAVVVLCGVNHLPHPALLLLARVLGAQHHEEYASCLIGVIVLRAALYALILQLLEVVVRGIPLHARVAVSVVVAHSRHDWEVGRHLPVLPVVHELILVERSVVHLVAHVHYHVDVLLEFAVFLVYLSFGSLHEPFISAALLELVVAHE